MSKTVRRRAAPRPRRNRPVILKVVLRPEESLSAVIDLVHERVTIVFGYGTKYSHERANRPCWRSQNAPKPKHGSNLRVQVERNVICHKESEVKSLWT